MFRRTVTTLAVALIAVVGYAQSEFETQDSLLYASYEAGDFDQALVHARAAKAAALEEFGEESENHATATNNLALILETVGEYEEAGATYQTALGLVEKVYGEESLEYAMSLENLAMFYRTVGEYDKAEPLFKRTPGLVEKALGDDSPDYGITLNNLGGFYLAVGNYPEAENQFDDALDILEEYPDDYYYEYTAAMNNVGQALERMGRYTEAIEAYENLREELRNSIGEEHPDYAIALNNLAYQYLAKGRYQDAEPLYHASLKITRDTYGDDHPETAVSYYNLAELYEKMGDYKRAGEYLKQALQIRLASFGEDHPDYANGLTRLGLLYHKTERLEQAEPMYNEALRIWRAQSTLGENHPGYAITLKYLAALYAAQEKYDEADKLLQEAIGLLEKTLGDEHAEYAAALHEYAKLKEFTGELDRAEELYEEALDIREEQLGTRHPDYGETLLGLARVRKAKGAVEDAKESFFATLKNYRDQIDNYFPALSETEKALFYNTLKGNYSVFYSFVADNPTDEPVGKMFDNRLFSKALIARATRGAAEKILASGDRELVLDYKRWLAMKEQLARLYKTPKEEIRAQNIDVDSLETMVNDLEKSLNRRAASFKRDTDDPETWQDVRDALEPKEAAVELVRFRYFDKMFLDSIYYAALVVTPNTQTAPAFVLIENGKELEKSGYDRYRESIFNREDDPALFDLFWKPLVGELEGVEKIYLSPDGVYNKINIETLSAPGGKYLYEIMEVEVVDNSGDAIAYAEKGEEKSSPNNAALLGYPNYTLSKEEQVKLAVDVRSGRLRGFTIVDDAFTPEPAEETETRSGFQRGLKIEKAESTPVIQLSKLPGTKVEVERIGKLAYENDWRTELYLDNEALEEVVKHAENSKVIHIATHGFFLPDVESLGSNALGIQSERAKENPLFRSGLFLAGVSKKTDKEDVNKGDIEDGILTSFEASNLDLEGCELVALSACETGLGEIVNGEGVYGLRRSLRNAGADAVLMSLWKVDDAATQDLMIAFYENWMETGDKRAAMNHARDVIREKYEHPYFWGAFILVGR